MKIRNLVKLLSVCLVCIVLVNNTYGQLQKTLCDNLQTIAGHTFVIAYEKEGKEYIMYASNGTELNAESILTTEFAGEFEDVTIENKAGRYFIVKLKNGEYLSRNGYGKLSADQHKTAFETKKTEAGFNEYTQPFEKRNEFYVKMTVNDDGTVLLGDNKTICKMYLVKI
ncbi:MAG: hypothetical protein JEZ09_06205 [Salinivirgaceae bacterium]|nr:hypothetical protein [Salinivirgaceae bacterium]